MLLLYKIIPDSNVDISVAECCLFLVVKRCVFSVNKCDDKEQILSETATNIKLSVFIDHRPVLYISEEPPPLQKWK